jgi:hypothetical protein
VFPIECSVPYTLQKPTILSGERQAAAARLPVLFRDVLMLALFAEAALQRVLPHQSLSLQRANSTRHILLGRFTGLA